MSPPAGRQERLDLLGGELPINKALDRLPARGVRRPARQRDTLLAILPRPATPPRLRLNRHSAQRRILPQTADHRHTHVPQRPQEGAFGIRPVGHDPDGFSRGNRQRDELPQGLHGQLQLGAELPGVLRWNPGNIRQPHIQQAEQRQTNRPPQRMTQHQRHRHPNVAVQKLLIGRPGRRIVMDAGALHLGTVALGGRIVHGHEQSLVSDRMYQQQSQEPLGQRLRSAPQRLQKVIVIGKVVADADGPQPSRDGPPPPRKDNPQNDQRQPPTVAGMQGARPARRPIAPNPAAADTAPSLALPLCGAFSNRSMMEEPFFMRDQFSLAKFSESADKGKARLFRYSNSDVVSRP